MRAHRRAVKKNGADVSIRAKHRERKPFDA
jgi:hypothetical protein